MPEQSRISGLIEELRRRRVFRVAAFYGGIAFVIVQIIDGTFEVMGIPAWVSRLMIILLAVGFPISMILAWVFDITPEGIVRTDSNGPSEIAPPRPIVGNLTLSVVVSLAILAAGWSWFRADSGSESTLGAKSVAVLPFVNIGASVDDEYFTDGVTDDIITHLAKIGDLTVISRTSIMLYKGSKKPLPVIAAELGVSNILEGTVRRVGDKVRITGQLINTRTDAHLWAESYDRNFTDIFAIQSDVAEKIATALKAKLTSQEKRYIESEPTDNMEAYDYYLKGKQLWNTSVTAAGNIRAAELLDTAAELDPNFTLAFAWAAAVHSVVYANRWDRSQARKDRAKAALDHAIALNPDHPTVHLAKGIYQEWLIKDNRAAMIEYELAEKGAPHSSDVALFLGLISEDLGRWKKAENYLLKVYDLNPLDQSSPNYLARFYRDQRQFEDARHYFSLAIQAAPTVAGYYRSQAINDLEGFGEIDKARAFLKASEMNVPTVKLLAEYYQIESYAHNFSTALDIAKKIKKTDPMTMTVGIIHALRGEKSLVQAEFAPLRIYYEGKVVEEPESAFFHSRLGLVYAYLGLKEKAIAAGKMGMFLVPVSVDHNAGPVYVERLATIYIITREHDLALDNLEYLFSIPGSLTKWDLRLSPTYDPLRERPRFIALVNRLDGDR